MGLKREKNRALAARQIEFVRQMAESSQIGALIWYRGLRAAEMYELQVAARQAEVTVKVVRNRLAHRALEGTIFSCLQSVLKGPVLLAFSQKDPKILAKLLQGFSKSHDSLAVKYLAFEGELLPASDLDSMANLPTKEEAIAHLLSALQSPVQQLLRVLAEPQIRFIRTLKAIKND